MQQNDQNPVDPTNVETTTDSEAQAAEVSVEELQAQIAKEQKEKAILQRKNTKLAKALNEEEETPHEPIKNPADNNQSSELEYLRIRDKGYSPEQAEWLIKNGGIAKIDDPVIKSALESYGKQAEAEGATDFAVSTKAGDGVKGYTKEDLQSMSSAELEKILPKA